MRKILIKKLEDLGVPTDLISQVVVFLAPLMVLTAGDVTGEVAVFTIELVQGGTASPALFRIYINELLQEVREALGMYKSFSSVHDPEKLVEDYVLLLAKNETKFPTLLDACTI